MREIEFKGYAKEKLVGSQWIIGGYGVEKVEYTDGTDSVHLFTPYGDYEVYEESVGQYIGLKDSKGNKIYEGDILKEIDGTILEVVWEDNGFKGKYTFTGKYQGEEYTETKYSELVEKDLHDRYKYEIIGNIYDDPELLEVKRK